MLLKWKSKSFLFSYVNPNFYENLFRLSTFLKLFGAMGLTWLLEVIAWLIVKTNDKPVHDAINVILNLPNVLQGLIIFCVFGIKKSVKTGIRKTYRYIGIIISLDFQN